MIYGDLITTKFRNMIASGMDYLYNTVHRKKSMSHGLVDVLY